MKRIYSMMEREFRLIFRNGISIFMVAAPAILALVFILVFGAVNHATLQIVVDKSVDQATVEKLWYVAQVEQLTSTADMEQRVRAADAVTGVTLRNGVPTAVFEGNEGQRYIDSTEELVGLALAAPEGGIAYRSEAVEAKGGMAYRLSMMSVLLLSLFIGGATVGLSIVEERESGVIRAVAVSPVRLSEYAGAKILSALALGLSGICAAALIIGKSALLPRYLLLSAASALVSGMMTFTIGAFANNQIAAIGVLKILVPLSLIVPLSALFVPDVWQFVYYVLPMYWQYRALNAILTGAPFLWPTLLTALVSIPWFAAALLHFSKKSSLQAGR